MRFGGSGRGPDRYPRRSGFALIAVLIVVVILSLAAYRYADSMTAEYQVAIRASEATQAKRFADSGIHYAMGALSDPVTLNDQFGGNPYDNPSQFANVALGPPDEARGGRFSLVSVGDTGSGSGESRYQVRYGALDESGKLNVNALIAQDTSGQVLYDALMKLPGMTEDVADAIVDWVDADDSIRDAGAESAYYQGLPQPYMAKNGPLNSVEELLLVRGVAWQMLFGNDRNRNGRLDPGEELGGDFHRGWSEYLTCYGRELDVDTDGYPRIDLAGTDLNALSEELTTALGQEMSDYILAARLYGTSSAAQEVAFSVSGNLVASTTSTQPASGGTIVMSVKVDAAVPPASGSGSNSSSTVTGGAAELRAAVQKSLDENARARNKVNSVLALANTRVNLPRAQAQPGQPQPPQVVVNSPLNDANKLKELLPLLLDKTTTRTAFEMAPRVNVNTAPPEVVAALPGLTPEDVDMILAVRGSQDPLDPATTTGAWLVTEANLTPTKFRDLEKYVTGKTMTYRVQSVGYFGQGGPAARVEAVIDTNQGHPRIVYYRDLTDLGRGFDLPR
jgi:type II secretory pathway component PulK